MKGNRSSISKLVQDTHADARMVGAIIGVLVVIVIGMLVYWQISSSISLTSTEGQTVHSDVNGTAVTVFQLAPIVAIVLIAGIILGVVTRFGGGAV